MPHSYFTHTAQKNKALRIRLYPTKIYPHIFRSQNRHSVSSISFLRIITSFLSMASFRRLIWESLKRITYCPLPKIVSEVCTEILFYQYVPEVVNLVVLERQQHVDYGLNHPFVIVLIGIVIRGYQLNGR